MAIDGIDLNDPERFVRGEHHEMFTRLRAEDPVYWQEDEFGGYWNVVKHQDLIDVNRDTALFSSELGGTQIPVTQDDPENFMDPRGLIMLEMDPPKHTRYRLLVNKGFTPRMIGLIEQALEFRAQSIVDEVIEKGECDFVEDIAAELPLQAIAEIMGVPQEDRRKLFEWSNRMIGAADPEYASDDQGNAFMELFAYSNALAAQRRDDPRDDIVTTLLNSEIEGEKLSELEFDMFMMLLAVAGNETTRNATAHAMHAFMTHPDQLALRAVRPRPVLRHRGRRGAALGHARAALPPHRHEGHRDPRPPDQGRRPRRHLAHLREPRRRGVGQPVRLRRHPQPEPAHCVRWRRLALLPRRQPRAAWSCG